MAVLSNMVLFLASAGTAVGWALTFVLLIGMAVLFVRLQALTQQLVDLQRELGRSRADLDKLAGQLAAQRLVAPAPVAPVPAPAPVAAPVPAPAPASIAPAPVAPAPDTLTDAKLVAVITAAAVAYLGKRVAVRRITFINQNTVSGWAEAGRISIHSSHNVRRN